MLFSTCKMSQHHQLYDNDMLKISCNNQTIVRVQQCKLLGCYWQTFWALYTCQEYFKKWLLYSKNIEKT